MSPPVVSAIISAAVSIIVTVIGSFGIIQAQRHRLEAELRTEFMAEEAIRKLLKVKGWELRSFEIIKKRIGGFNDEDLRKLLVRAGALRFFRNRDGEELWGLREKNARLLGTESFD